MERGRAQCIGKRGRFGEQQLHALGRGREKIDLAHIGISRDVETSVLMQRLSYRTKTVLSNKINRNYRTETALSNKMTRNIQKTIKMSTFKGRGVEERRQIGERRTGCA